MIGSARTGLGSVPTAQETASGLLIPAEGLAAPYWYSELIDFKQTGTYIIIPPAPWRLRPVVPSIEIVSTSGVTVSPTVSAGVIAPNFVDMYAAQAPAGFVTAPAHTFVVLNSVVPLPNSDLTTSGFRLRVSNPATATTLIGRYSLIGLLTPV